MSHALKKAKANSIKLGVAQLLHLNFFYIRYFWRPWLCLLNTAAHYFINSVAAARTTKGSFQIKKEMWQASMLLARARASIFKNQTVCRGKRKNDTTLGGRGGEMGSKIVIKFSPIGMPHAWRSVQSDPRVQKEYYGWNWDSGEIRNTKLIPLEILVQAKSTVHCNQRLSLFFSLSFLSIAFDPLWGNSQGWNPPPPYFGITRRNIKKQIFSFDNFHFF